MYVQSLQNGISFTFSCCSALIATLLLTIFQCSGINSTILGICNEVGLIQNMQSLMMQTCTLKFSRLKLRRNNAQCLLPRKRTPALNHFHIFALNSWTKPANKFYNHLSKYTLRTCIFNLLPLLPVPTFLCMHRFVIEHSVN